MKKHIFTYGLLVFALATFAAPFAAYAASGTTPIGGTTAVGGTSPVGGTTPVAINHCAHGVLVTSACANELSFTEYLSALLTQLMPLVLFFAVIAIAASGLQYMMGGLTPDASKKAKQRIVGIIMGGLLFVSINLILRQLANGISLTPAEPALQSNSGE